MNKQNYQKKYFNLLNKYGITGYYKISSAKDIKYYQDFMAKEPLDFYHLGDITYAVFYNPDTQDVIGIWETDWSQEGLDNFVNEDCNNITYYDCPKEVKEQYYEKCKEERYQALKNSEEGRYLTSKKHADEGILYNPICTGDTVEVFKGKKLPIGSTHKVKRQYDYEKGYIKVTYLQFEDGTSTQAKNCKIIELRPFEKAIEENKEWLNLEDR